MEVEKINTPQFMSNSDVRDKRYTFVTPVMRKGIGACETEEQLLVLKNLPNSRNNAKIKLKVK